MAGGGGGGGGDMLGSAGMMGGAGAHLMPAAAANMAMRSAYMAAPGLSHPRSPAPPPCTAPLAHHLRRGRSLGQSIKQASRSLGPAPPLAFAFVSGVPKASCSFWDLGFGLGARRAACQETAR